MNASNELLLTVPLGLLPSPRAALLKISAATFCGSAVTLTGLNFYEMKMRDKDGVGLDGMDSSNNRSLQRVTENVLLLSVLLSPGFFAGHTMRFAGSAALRALFGSDWWSKGPAAISLVVRGTKR